MYDIYIGKQKSIVFPIMCNAHINIGYSANIPDILSTPSDTTDDAPHGLWAHSGSFTFEAILTPYDINGTGETGLRGRTAQQTNDLIMPQGGAGKISEAYLPVADRYSHEMCIFHNDNFRITLLNATSTNNNQPAEYKIKVYLTLNSVQETFTSPVVISSSVAKNWSYGDSHVRNNLSGFNKNGEIIYDSVARLTTNHTIGTTINVNTTEAHGSRALADIFYEGQEVYTRDGFTFTSIGTIASGGVNPSSLTLTSNPGLILDETELYIPTFKEPKYAENMHHIAVSYNNAGKTVRVFYNRRLVLTGIHSEVADFSFARTDCILGKNTSSNNDASTDMQFMGELHELAIENFEKTEITYTNSLFPAYDTSLLYLRFEEVDL
jgi:hypothetical protein